MNLYKEYAYHWGDIVDTGTTLTFLLSKSLRRRIQRPSRFAQCDKPSRRTTGFVADYIGFTVDDLFIIGYGLDF